MIGQTLGPYRIERELGSGGMGTVFAAVVEGRVPGLDTGTRVALKIVHPHLLETPGFFKRFLREAELGKTIRHENVVCTYDSDALAAGGVHQHFLVMEYVEGQTLRELLDDLGRVPEELCRHIGHETAKGVAAIHAAGVLHRDLKPENIIISLSAAKPDDDVAERPSAGRSRDGFTREGNVQPQFDHVVQVMDLGVARLRDEIVRLSQTGVFVGSIHYAAPEHFGGGTVDHRADLHALGLLLYELASGQHPYYDEDLRVALQRLLHEQPRRVGEINPQLSPFFEEVIHTLIAKDPAARVATADELVDILEAGEASPWWLERARMLRIETRRPLRRVRVPRETALFGRDTELAALRALFDKAQAGDGQVVLIEGEAGIGKTRIVDEFVGRLRQEGEDLNFLFGSYPPGGAATAAGAFSTAYREHFGDVELEETLADYLPGSRILAPALAALLRGEPQPKGAEPLTKDSLQTVFVRVTRGLATERPTIVLIDDLHFAPDEGRALFAALAAAVADHAVLLVGTARPGLRGDWLAAVDRAENATRLQLPRLGPKDLIRLLEDALRSQRLADKLASQVAAKTDGNPYFVFEVIRGLREGQYITQREDGSWISTRVIDEIEMPSSIADLIHARIADLGEEEQDLLEIAACCGYEFDPLLVGEVLGLPRIPLLKRFGRIERTHRLVRSVGRRCMFDHHQVQEALYAGLSELLREEYHAAIGDALQAREGALDRDPIDLGGPLCVDLCQHLLKGARGASAVRYLDAALEHLVAGHMNAPAVELADLALAVPGLVTGDERAELLLREADRLNFLGRREAERAALDEALALADEGGGLALRARARAGVGWHLLIVGDYEEAEGVLTRALDLARQAGDKKTEAEATGTRGSVFLHTGRYEEAREQYERRRALALEMGDRRLEAHSLGNLGATSWSRGRYDEAREYFERYLALGREIGNRPAVSSATGNLGALAFVRGDCGAALDYYERSLALTSETGERQSDASSLSNLGLVFNTLGRPEMAREQFHESIAICHEIGSRRVEGGALDGLAAAADALGEAETAERVFREALALHRGLGSPGAIAYSLTFLGTLLAGQGRGPEASALLIDAADTARQAGLPGVRVLSACQLALLPGGDAEAARAAFVEFADGLMLFERMEARFLLWKSEHEHADLAEAQRLLEHVRDHAPEEYRDSVIEGVALHRDIAAAAREAGL